MELKPITETCVPRPDVLAGGLDDRDFAAQLDKVVLGDMAYEAYTDAGKFFDLTHPTSGLREMIESVFGHLTGKGGSSLLRAQTTFGGGKTHSLIALYHLASGFRPDNLAEFVDEPAVLPTGKVRVAAVVGDHLDPVAGSTVGGQTAFTLWGEIASQLGQAAWDAISAHDAARTAPGTEAIRKMLDGGPAIIVIDELAQHLHQCAKAGREDIRNQAEQIAPFLKNLSEEIDGRDDVVVVITLAASTDAYAGATDQLEGVFKDIGAVLARKGRDIQPASETEIAEILKRRLFTSVDADAADAAVSAFTALYESAGEEVGITAKVAATTVDRLAITYPFHPELVNALDKRIGTIPKFQRTRGALRLLSRVIAEVWRSDDPPVVLNVADLPFGSTDVVKELTVRIDREKFQQVVQSDIAGDPGHAGRIDDERYQGRPVVRRAATTVFAHSLEETAESGSPVSEIALGSLRPGDDAGLIEDGLSRLYDQAWHLTWDNVRWKFQTAPNANRIVDSEADRVLPSMVADERVKLLQRMCRSTATIATHIYPDDLDAVPDEQKLHVAVPHHDTVKVTGKTGDTIPAVLQDARGKSGSGKPRRNRNGIAFLVSDADRVEDMDRAVRRMIAARRIADNDSQMQSYGDSVQADIRKIADVSMLGAHIAVGRCYKHLYYPAANKAVGDLTHVELPANVQGAIGDNLPKSGSLPDGKAWTDQVWTTLVSNEKVRSSDKAIGTDWLRKKAWPTPADRVRTVDLLDVFWTDHSAELLTDTTPVAKSIQQGVTNGAWVLQDMRDATDDRGKVHSNRAGGGTPPPVTFHGDVWLVDYQVALDEGLMAVPPTVTDVVKPIGTLAADGQMTAVELRAVIEKAKGHEPSKAEVREALANAIRQNRVVVEKDGEPVKPGDLTGDKVGFDDLIIRRPADDEGDVTHKITRTRRFEQPAAIAAEKLTGWASELITAGHTAGLTSIGVTVTMDEETNAAGTLILMVGSVPDIPDVTFNCDIEYGIAGIDGEMTITINAADRHQTQQTIKALLSTIAGKAASPIAGDATVTFVLDQPHAPAAPRIKSLLEAITTYFTGPVRLTGKVA